MAWKVFIKTTIQPGYIDTHTHTHMHTRTQNLDCKNLDHTYVTYMMTCYTFCQSE